MLDKLNIFLANKGAIEIVKTPDCNLTYFGSLPDSVGIFLWFLVEYPTLSQSRKKIKNFA